MPLVSHLFSADKILLAASVSLAGLISLLCLYIYRAYFDSLSHIPGPKLAAATLWYEFYWDVIRQGRYTWRIEEMHQKYGPVVRISPHEVHVYDPEFIDEIYPGPTVRTNKYKWAVRAFALDHAAFAVESHELHRIRRATLSNYFSFTSLRKQEPKIQLVIDRMLDRIRKLQGSGSVVKVQNMFACLTADIISQYGYGETFGYLKDPDFCPWWHDMMIEVSINGHMIKQFPWIISIMNRFPENLIKIIHPLTYTLIQFRKTFRKQASDVQKAIALGDVKVTDEKTSIFHEILLNPKTRPEEKELDYLQDEAQTVIAAGTVTTAHILSMLTFYIIDNPLILQRLQAELSPLFPTPNANPPTWLQLEQLPYLTGIITEGLRVGYGVSHRLQREFPDRSISHTDKNTGRTVVIPPSTPVAMTTVHIHNDPSLFPDPKKFDPERWIKNPELKRYLLSFGKGTRQCLGFNLAWGEMYLCLANLFAPGRFAKVVQEGKTLQVKGMRPYDTTWERDVEINRDFFNVVSTMETKGIRIVFDELK